MNAISSSSNENLSIDINQPSTSKAADIMAAAISNQRNKRKLTIDESSAAALCSSTAQMNRLIRSLKRRSAVVFVYKCRETLHSMMPIDTRPTAIALTPAPTMPNSKRKKLIIQPSKLTNVIREREAAMSTSMSSNNGTVIDASESMSAIDENPVDKISNLFDHQLKIKEAHPFDIESLVKP